MKSKKDEIRARIIALREQMERIATKEHPTSDDLTTYKHLSSTCDALIKQLFSKGAENEE